MRSLVPFYRSRLVSRRRPEDADPLLAFRHEMNRVFSDFFGGFSLPSVATPQPAGTLAVFLTPQMDVSETVDEIQITVELPGLDEEDVEVSLDGDLLTIRGEKETERDEEERDYHVIERVEGTFLRSVRLPFEPDPDQVQAVFRDGVLTITIAKPKEVQEQDKTHKIEVKREEEAAGTQRADRAAAGDKPSASGAQAGASGAQTSTGGGQASTSKKPETAAE